MAIRFLDLLPEEKNKIEKESLFIAKRHKPSFIEEKKQETKEDLPSSSILDTPLDSDLEIALARITRTKEEIEQAKEERQRRITISNQAKKNSWSKRIKSKGYRKIKREEKQKEQATKEAIINTLTEELSTEEAIPQDAIPQEAIPQEAIPQEAIKQEPLDIFHTYTRPMNSQIEEVLGIDKEFSKEKQQEIEKDLPREEEIVLPGWNSWGGTETETVKSSANTTLHRRTGVEVRKRKDFLSSHVIYNERSEETRNTKYSIQSIPYGYSSHEEYEEFLSMRIDADNPLRILKKIIQDEKNT